MATLPAGPSYWSILLYRLYDQDFPPKPEVSLQVNALETTKTMKQTKIENKEPIYTMIFVFWKLY